MKMNSNPIPNPAAPKWVNARNESRAFMLAAQRCNEHRPLPSGHFQFLLVPSLVCYAFSAEVGLKALALHRGKDPRNTHDLKTLFADLTPEARAGIVEGTSRAGIVPDAEDAGRFDSNLEVVRSVFDDWRYIYEENRLIGTDLGFLQRFAAAIQKALDVIQ